MQSEIAVALITSVIGGLLVAIVNHILTRRKYNAEIDKLKAETEKIRSETRHELNETKYYDSPTANEKIIYDGTKGIAGYDIHSIYAACDIQKGMMIIQVDKWGWGRFELQNYTYEGKSYPYIPKDETISGLRRFHISYEVKAIGASYEVSAFLWETPEVEDEPSIDDRNVDVNNSEWKLVHFYLKAPPNKNYTVNIGTQHTSGGGSLQIRRLIVTERIDS